MPYAMNDNDARERVWRFCGKPSGEREFFTLPGRRHWAHSECMLQAGREAMASGKLDAVWMAIYWGDGSCCAAEERDELASPHVAYAAKDHGGLH